MTAVFSRAPDPGLLGLQRRLRAVAPDASAVTEGEFVLESAASAKETPRLVRAPLIEGGAMRARRVPGDPLMAFAAFLDGTQASRIVAYADGRPVVHGTVAAVIRERRNRRLATWHRPIVARRLYAPLRLLSADWERALQSLDIPLVDTTPAPSSAGDSPHPFVLRDIAIHQVQADRERAEHELAERWCRHENAPLFIDGSISGSERVAEAECAVGVVKSHGTLYSEGDALLTIFRLRRGERSSVFRITSPKRTPVASWYLRVRDPAGHDPMWGLVRVEVAETKRVDEPAVVGTRADEVSRWIFGEAAPLALPDSRWDKMVYGIRDCEEFLRAVT